METTISVSVRKLGSVGRESDLINRILTVAELTSCGATAVGLGVTSVAPASWVMLNAPRVGRAFASAAGVAVSAATAVELAVPKATSQLDCGAGVAVLDGSSGSAEAAWVAG